MGQGLAQTSPWSHKCSQVSQVTLRSLETTHRPAHGAVADPSHRMTVSLVLTQTRAGAVSSVCSWRAGVITQGSSPASSAATRPRLGITDTSWDIVCDQVCHLNILVRIFSMRLGLPLPGYCEVMAVTRVTTHIYISLSRRIRIKILSPNYIKLVSSSVIVSCEV